MQVIDGICDSIVNSVVNSIVDHILQLLRSEITSNFRCSLTGGILGGDFELIVVSGAVDSSRLAGGGDKEDELLLVGEGTGVLPVEKGSKSRSLKGSVAFSKSRTDLGKAGLSTAQSDGQPS